MTKSLILPLLLIPVVYGCKSADSAIYSTDWGKIDARELAKECVDLQQNNPTKFKINTKYQVLCRDPKFTYEFCTGCEREKTHSKVVSGYMKLIREGRDISSISPKQVIGSAPTESPRSGIASNRSQPSSSSNRSQPSSSGKKTNSLYDDETITEETLWDACELGVMGNGLNNRGYGYMEYITKGRMAVGNMTIRDYQSLRRWFESNCPDGW